MVCLKKRYFQRLGGAIMGYNGIWEAALQGHFKDCLGGGVDHRIIICGLGFSIQFLLWCCHLKVCLENRKNLEVFFKRYRCKANIEAKPRLFCSIVLYDVVCLVTSSDIFQWYCKLGFSLWITWHATSISIPAYHPLI